MEGQVIEGFGIAGNDFGDPWDYQWLLMTMEIVMIINHDYEYDFETHCSNIVQ